jgi:hypothetical protein
MNYEKCKSFGLKYSVCFSLCVIIGFSLFFAILVARWLPTQLDEGISVYQMGQVIHGGIPFKDIYTPSPGFLWLAFPFLKIFGYSLFAGRMLTIIVSATSIPFIYLIGRELFNRRVGLIAASIFAFGPTIIILDVTVNYRSVAFSLATISLAFLILGIKKNNWFFYFLFGFLIGFDIWVYRGVALLALTGPLIVLLLNRLSFTNKVKEIGFIALGGFLAFGGVGFYLVHNSSFALINFAWGLGTTHGSGSITDFAAGQAPQWSIIGRFLNWSNFVSYFNFNTRIFYIFTRDWLYLILTVFLFIGLFIRKWILGNIKWFSLLFSIFMVIFALLFYRGQSLEPRLAYQTYVAPLLYENITLIVFVLLLSLGFANLLSVRFSRQNGHKDSFSYLFLVSWFLSILIPLVLNSITHAAYALNFASIFCIMTAVILDVFVTGIDNHKLVSLPPDNKHKKMEWFSVNGIRLLFVITFLSTFVVTGLSFFSSLAQGRVSEYSVSLTTVREIGDYIKTHTENDDEIFSQYPLIAVFANRNLVLNVSNMWLYQAGNEPVPKSIGKFDSAPSIDEIMQQLKTGKVKYIIHGTDPIWSPLFYSFGDVAQFTNLYYKEETEIAGYKIMRLREPYIFDDSWDLASNLENVSIKSEIGSYKYFRQTWTEEPNNVLVKPTFLDESSQVDKSLKPNQILLHPSIQDTTTFVTINIPSNHYTRLVTDYGIPDLAVEKTNGIKYTIELSTDGGNSYAQLFSTDAKQNVWKTEICDLTPYIGKNITFRLSSKGLGNGYYWLQITFMLTNTKT